MLLHWARVTALLDLGTIPFFVIGTLAGIATADFVTGVVHWACDTWGSARTRWLGERLIFSFREHHEKPHAMLKHDAVDVNGGAATAVFAVLLGVTALSANGWFPPTRDSMFIWSFFLGLLAASALANQLHYWAHTQRCPRFVRRLQRAGFLLAPAKHAEHHRAPHLHGYCISTGWLNRPLDAIGFWRWFERVVSNATGAVPRTEERSR